MTDSSSPRVDVLILTALLEELEAVLEAAAGPDEWQEVRDRQGFRYYRRMVKGTDGRIFSVAAAWAGGFGEAAVELRGRELIDALAPKSLAMCGVCAGNPDRVSLGDVIIADRILNVEIEPYRSFRHLMSEYAIYRPWKTEAAYFARNLEWASELQKTRPPSMKIQEWWLLDAMYQARSADGPSPVDHPDRKLRCPNWAEVIKSLRYKSFIETEGGVPALTDSGWKEIESWRLLYPDGVPGDPPFRVHVGAIATVSKGRNEANIFREIAVLGHQPLGVELEGAAALRIAEGAGIPAIIVKSVSDFSDGEKLDAFRAFASRAAAVTLVELLPRLLAVRDMATGWSRAAELALDLQDAKTDAPERAAQIRRIYRELQIEHLTINGLRNIDHLDLDFTGTSALPGKWTCIAGINGAGKSSVLQAIALVLLGGRLVPELGGDWLQRIRRQVGSVAQACEIRAKLGTKEGPIDLFLPIGDRGVNTDLLDVPNHRAQRAFWNARAESHLLLAYGAGRNLSEHIDSRHESKSIELRRLMTLFDPLTQVASAETLLKQERNAEPAIAMLRRLLDTVLEDAAITIVADGPTLQFKTGSANLSPVDLPDGFRATIAWLADLCAAWNELAPEEAKGGDPSTIRAIVLIDEIDLHLHPRLQRVLVPRLRQALPHVQWIVTTHSPLVLSSFDSSELVMLESNSEGGVQRRALDRQVLGFSTDEVYEWLMETRPLSAAIDDVRADSPIDAKERLALLLAQSPEVSAAEAETNRAWRERQVAGPEGDIDDRENFAQQGDDQTENAGS